MLVVNLVRSLILVVCLALAADLLDYVVPSIAQLTMVVVILGTALTLADLAEQKLIDLFDR